MATAPGSKSAAFFDLDKTVIARSSALAFSRPFYAGGLITRRTVLRSAYAHFVFQAQGADHDQMERMRLYMSQMVAGWEVDQVRAIVEETLTEIIVPSVFAEAQKLIASHQESGRDVVLVSSSGTDVVEPIGAMLGVDRVLATQMVVKDGRYTGEIATYTYAEGKPVAMRELAEKEGYDLSASYAYSDSVTDLPMLTSVGHPTAVNPDRALRREAIRRGWPILDFTHPVTLRRRFADRVAGLPPVSTQGIALGILALSVTAVVFWYLGKRRARA